MIDPSSFLLAASLFIFALVAVFIWLVHGPLNPGGGE